MIEHALPPIGRDQSQLHAARIDHAIQVRMIHRARMKRRDLVGIQVGGDVGLRRELAIDGAYMLL